MSDAVVEITLRKIKNHCESSKQPRINITFHGGEPMLVKAERVASWCRRALEILDGLCEVDFAIQTNGTLITDDWVEVFKTYNVRVGISLDGPQSVNDTCRLDHKGRGSFDLVMDGISVLKANEIPFGILTVIQFGDNSLETYDFFKSLGCTGLGYLLPHYTHESVDSVHEVYGRTPCADYLLPVMRRWLANDTHLIRIREFWSIARLIMGGRSSVDSIGNDPYGYLFVEADGEIEGLDILRTCAPEFYQTGLSVFHNEFVDIFENDKLAADTLSGQVPISDVCKSCPEGNTCSGGYLPHRYSRLNKFDNTSVWCEDLKMLFAEMRKFLETPILGKE